MDGWITGVVVLGGITGWLAYVRHEARRYAALRSKLQTLRRLEALVARDRQRRAA